VADHLIVAVARNAGKNPLLAIEERLELVRAEIAELNNPAEGRTVEARPFDNLLMHFAQSVGASLIVRGLRAVSDFEYEFQMAGMNARLDPAVDTVFLMASESHQFISSRFVKEIGRLGGDISSFVSPRVAQRLTTRFAQERKNGDHAGARVQTLEDSTGPRSPI
jgi:pantetheine-phosphate adenylyltransferase